MKKIGITSLLLLLIIVSLISMSRMITKNTFVDLIKQSKPSVLNLITDSGFGSGFIVKYDNKIRVITSRHVIAGTSEIIAKMLIDNSVVKVCLRAVSISAQTDLAILKFSDPNIAERMKPIKLGNSDNVREGEFVLALGNPMGLGYSSSRGMISVINRAIKGAAFPDAHEYLQLDISVNRGNSGGPLINLSGEVIGVITAVAERRSNIVFAIPINIVKKELAALQMSDKN